VLVVWEDIHQSCEWTDNDGVKAHHTKTCYTTGWIRETTKTELKIATSIILGKSRKDDSSDVISIPRGCITQIKTLKTSGDYK
jgi:hypothetical protein